MWQFNQKRTEILIRVGSWQSDERFRGVYGDSVTDQRRKGEPAFECLSCTRYFINHHVDALSYSEAKAVVSVFQSKRLSSNHID